MGAACQRAPPDSTPPVTNRARATMLAAVTLLAAIAAATALLWALAVASARRLARTIPRLADGNGTATVRERIHALTPVVPPAAATDAPTVSVIVPARDE